MSFFHRLFRWHRPSPQAQPAAVAAPLPASLERPADWDADDAGELRVFLRSEAGRRFGELLRQRVALSAQHAVRTAPDRLAWECGRSAGIEDTVGQIDLLADWQGELVRESNGEECVRRFEDEEGDDLPDDDLLWLSQDEDDEDGEHEYRS